MGGIIVVIASSAPLGASLGVLAATWRHGAIRPCRMLRERETPARASAVCVALASTVAGLAASFGVAYERPALLATCVAVVALTGFATWVLLIEADDDDRFAASGEPEWWPTFERELEAWSRREPAEAPRR